MIALKNHACVRAVTKNSTCTKCKDICPTEAITIDATLPTLMLSKCVGCSGCNGICPSEALIVDNFSSTEFFFDFVSSEKNIISCKSNVPCISAISAENLFSLTLMKGDIIFDMSHCSNCELAHTLKPQIQKNSDEVNYILEAMQKDSRVKLDFTIKEEEPKEENEPNRREFLNNFSLSGVGKQKQNFDRAVEIETVEAKEHSLSNVDTAAMRSKNLQDSRKILFTALKRVTAPEIFHVIEAKEISFMSEKDIDLETCTNCQMCYRICPTKALSSDYKNSRIDFDAGLCIKCTACHDVCEPNSITLKDTFKIENFFKAKVENLAKFTVRKCNECENYFTYRGGEVTCERCRVEEDEAKELWGLR